MKKILSIDGGGIRGIIPAAVLAEIERRTGTGIAETFDLIAGTSTGGIIALGLNVPDCDGGPLHKAATLKELYETKGLEIFRINLWRKLTTMGGYIQEEYTANILDEILDKFLGETRHGSCITNTFVTSYDIERGKPFVFKSWVNEHRQVRMKDAARATSAAPGFFEPAVLELDGERHTLIDGGVYINNPALSAYLEAIRIFPAEDEFVLVSLGTGETSRRITYEEARNWGKIDWALPVLDVIIDGMSDAVDYHLVQILGDGYHRFQNVFMREGYKINLAPETEDEVKFIADEAASFVGIKSIEIDRLCGILSRELPKFNSGKSIRDYPDGRDAPCNA